MATQETTGLGAIRRDEAYPLEVFKTRFGVGEWAVREMRRDGLPVRHVGNRSYVLGDDVLDYLRQQPARAGQSRQLEEAN